MNKVARLSAWYAAQCNDEWHEDNGIEINTLDNPGWVLKVDLGGTSLEKTVYQEVKIDRSEEDWVVARRSGITFEAFGGANNLEEIIEIFLNWAEENNL